jgi:porphobilinogen synthase
MAYEFIANGAITKAVALCESELCNDGIVQQALRALRPIFKDVLLITDECFCEYTDHGHCGVVENDDVANDPTLALLQEQAVNAARAGADVVAPSAMMDGQVLALRTALDAHGFSHVAILSYSSKLASAFYSPFRQAADSSFRGTRHGYQMQIANGREAIAESLADANEGADVLMVKPGLAYLDVLCRLRQETHLPIAIFQVSGEYSMIKFASQAGALDERAIVLETLLAMKRAGADLILTYYALEAAAWCRGG